MANIKTPIAGYDPRISAGSMGQRAKGLGQKAGKLESLDGESPKKLKAESLRLKGGKIEVEKMRRLEGENR